MGALVSFESNYHLLTSPLTLFAFLQHFLKEDNKTIMIMLVLLGSAMPSKRLVHVHIEGTSAFQTTFFGNYQAKYEYFDIELP